MTLKKERLAAIVDLIQYKPGWRFDLKPVGGHMYLQVRFDAWDPDSKLMDVQYGRKWLLSEHMTEGEVVQTALMAVLAAEEHEARELFSYQGKRVFNPHFAMDALVSIAEQTETRH